MTEQHPHQLGNDAYQLTYPALLYPMHQQGASAKSWFEVWRTKGQR